MDFNNFSTAKDWFSDHQDFCDPEGGCKCDKEGTDFLVQTVENLVKLHNQNAAMVSLDQNNDGEGWLRTKKTYNSIFFSLPDDIQDSMD